MKKNNLKNTIDFVGLDYPKEILKIVAIVIVTIVGCVISYLFLKNIIISLLISAFGVGLIYLLISSYSNKKSNILKSRDEEFINSIYYFQTFINNKNSVYQAFNKMLDISSEWMRTRINKFLEDIDNDKTVKPYSDFADEFALSSAKNIMLSIYQMVDEGENGVQLTQFTLLFQQVNQTYQIELKDRKIKTLSNLTIFPLIGSGGMTILLSVAIISMVGDLINGI